MLFKKKQSLFGKRIQPACEYCEFSRSRGKKNNQVMCVKKGIVSVNDSCKKFVYAPLKRKPKRLVPLPKYVKEDFVL